MTSVFVLRMEMLRRLSLRNAGIEIVKRTITEEFPNKEHDNQWNNNDWKNVKNAQLYGTENVDHSITVNGHVKGGLGTNNGPDDDDFVVIELVDEVEKDLIGLDDNFVDIGMKSSRQILLYPTRKRRLYSTCRIRAVSHATVLRKYSTGLTVLYLMPFFRLTVSPTERWYVTHHSSIFVRPVKRGCQRNPIHYTERVEFHDGLSDGKFARKKPPPSSMQLIFSDEKNNEVSKLTLSSDFTLSYEEKHLKLHEVSRSIDLSEESDNRGTLKRSYSIEFLNEERSGDFSMSAANISKRMAEDDAKHVYDDSMEEPSERSFESTSETPTLKRSFSIEFLNEDEDRPLSSEVVHYKMEKGEGVLVYSESEAVSDSQDSSRFEDEQHLKRSFSIEFLNESDDKKSEFSYETVSNKIEKGEGRLIYDDTVEVQSHHNASWNKWPREKLKTLGIEMEVHDKDDISPFPSGEQQKAYNIELLKEAGADEGFNYAGEEDDEVKIVAAQAIVDESGVEEGLFAPFEEFYDGREDDPNLERRRFNLEVLEETPCLNLDLKGTSTPLKERLHSPKKSPLQTVHIGLEYAKRDKRGSGDDELFMNHADEYLVYEGKSGAEGGRNGVKEPRWKPSFNLETVDVNMDPHHTTLLRNRRLRLDFQNEPEQQISARQDDDNGRFLSGSSASTEIVYIEAEEEEVNRDENELKPPELLKKKAYSVEYLNEMEGDRSVFYEEFIDEGEPRWTLDI